MEKFLIIFFTNNDLSSLRKGLLIAKINCSIEEEQKIIDNISQEKPDLLDFINQYQAEEADKIAFTDYYQQCIGDDISDLVVEVARFFCLGNSLLDCDTCKRCITKYGLSEQDVTWFYETLLAMTLLQGERFVYCRQIPYRIRKQ